MKPTKRLADLTNKEILAIKVGSPEYNHLIDLECAHAGINLLPEHPGNAPVTPDIKPDAQLYKVGNWGFKSILDAQSVINYMADKGIFQEETKANVSVMRPMDESHYQYPGVKTVPVYTEAAFAQIKSTLEETAAVQSAWKEKNDEYQAVTKERKAITDDFNKQVIHAEEIESNTTKICNSIKRYLTLAQGSYPIAITFLKEADKNGTIHIENENVYYVCTSNQHHLVMTREQHQHDSMANLLEVDLKE